MICKSTVQINNHLFVKCVHYGTYKNILLEELSGLSHSVIFFTDRSKVEHFFVIYVLCLSRQFIAVLWSPEGKGLTSWLLFVMFIVIVLLSQLVSWNRCGT